MYSKGISWIDDCRIPFVDEGDIKSATPGSLNATGEFSSFGFKSGNELNTTGRFPANILVCDDMLNDGVVYSSGSGDGKMEMININDAHHFNFIEKNRKVVKMKGVQYNDKGSNSRYYDIDKWFDNIISE
jgi:hypothetical protein